MTTASENSTIEANGITIHYQVSGAGEALILLHGGTATLDSWAELLPAFAQHFKVYALDSRGHGKTDNPAGTLSYRQMGDDVAAFIAAMHLERPTVMGYSDGGQIALELGVRHAGAARALVLGGTLYKMTPEYFEAIKAWGIDSPDAMDFEGFEQNASEWVEYLKGAHPRDDDPDYWKTLMQQIGRLWLTPIAYSAEDLGKVSVPTLVALGDRDETIDVEQAVEMYRMLAQGELAIFPNANHETTFNQLESRLVLDFLLKQRAGG